METLGDNFVAKSGIFDQHTFYCELCDYKCCKKYNWQKHILTLKHKKTSVGNIDGKKVAKSGQKWQKNLVIYTCEFCEKYMNLETAYGNTKRNVIFLLLKKKRIIMKKYPIKN